MSHEPHFTLLREVVNFNQQRKSPQDPKNVSKTVVKTTSTAEFQLLHVAVLREYLQMDLCRDLYLLPAQVNVFLPRLAVSILQPKKTPYML